MSNKKKSKTIMTRVAGAMLTASVALMGSGTLMLLRGCSAADTPAGKGTTQAAVTTAGTQTAGSAKTVDVTQADPEKAKEAYLDAFAYERSGDVDYELLKGKYEEAVSYGSARAMTRLGNLYRSGYLGVRDDETARACYEQAIEAGDAGGGYNGLGKLYENGYQTEQSYEKALEYYQKGAEEGNADALGNLGDLYYNGYAGLERSDEEAIALYEQAAAAEEGTFWMYFYGRGVERDFDKAAAYFRAAADDGSADGYFGLYRCSLYGQGLPQDREKAIGYLTEAVTHNPIHWNAMNTLAGRYFRGDGVPQDSEKAWKILKTAYDMKSTGAMLYMGCVYRDGDFEFRNPELAMAYFNEALEEKAYSAAGYIAFLYAEENGVEKDLEKAWQILDETAAKEPDDYHATDSTKAWLYLSYSDEEGDAEKGFHLLQQMHEKQPYETDITVRLATCYRDGKGVAEDKKKAMELYEEAVSHGNLDAYSYLAWMHFNGSGTETNVARARELWEEALAIDPDNKTILGNLAQSYFNEKDYETALSYYERTKELGYNDYLTHIANMHAWLGDFDRALEEAEYSLEKNTGYRGADSLNVLGNLYMSEKAPYYDPATAFDYFKEAADYLPGNANAMLEYGVACYRGEYVEKDDEEAFAYCLKAAERQPGNANACYWAGAMYFHGCGTAKDEAKAKEWLLKAKEAGAQQTDLDTMLQQLGG